MMHFLHKLTGTLHILGCLFMARMFGEYEHSGWDGQINFARYRWRGETWIIPTSSAETTIL
ncbi:MAG TPA: hypothetical protein VLC51_07280 [Nitrospira sp.]|nr:hypothetical protein [Nitrospira sp.]